MAANKFATMLHKNTNNLTFILVYAMLEWVLIILILLNSLFSYLIVKFADYFGLKRPCLWCSRLDHLFEPSKFQNSYRSLVCETHAIEISELGYCSNHRKLAESQDMCEDCSSFPPQSELLSKKFAFFPWMKKLGVLQDCCGGDKVSQNVDIISKSCSCCGVSLDTELFCHDNYAIKPSWADSDLIQKGNSVWKAEIDDELDEKDHSDMKRSGDVCDRWGEEQKIDENKVVEEVKKDKQTAENVSCIVCSSDCKEMMIVDRDEPGNLMEKEQEFAKKDDMKSSVDEPSCDQSSTDQNPCCKEVSSENQPHHLEFFIDQGDCHLIPIELVDSTPKPKRIPRRKGKEDVRNYGNEDFVFEFDSKHVGTHYELVMEGRRNFEVKLPLLPIQECEENMDDELEPMDLNGHQNENELEDYVGYGLSEENGDGVQENAELAAEGMESESHKIPEELQIETDELGGDGPIGKEIHDHEPVENLQAGELPSSTSNSSYHENTDLCCKEDAEDAVEFRAMTVETSGDVVNACILCSESNNVEEDKIPDTPTSVDSPHHSHKGLLLLERRESSAEESIDGSVLSDIDANDGVLTVEKLKSALRSERKALNALYAELEEERSASAVAANQTMAMINRLQEEKAAMQMEALQYQRMMEEQSEYDQEALQLLNELMIKREKERAELEKELEIYRKKALDYEVKERLKRRKESSIRSGTSSASYSNAEDSDGLSVDMNHEVKEEENGFDNHQENVNQNTPVDAVVYLEESLNNFEEERISILEQLKVLEEKLFTLSDEEDQHFEDVKPIEHLCEENESRYYEDFDHPNEANGVANGHNKEMNGKHHQERRIVGTKAKSLLPLFDAIEAETEDRMLNGHEEGVIDPIAMLKSLENFELSESRNLAIEVEVDHVYERLQALEADREFLKHCITSLKKGDKGLELLQEILHHLRDLRSVEFRARKIENGTAV